MIIFSPTRSTTKYQNQIIENYWKCKDLLLILKSIIWIINFPLQANKQKQNNKYAERNTNIREENNVLSSTKYFDNPLITRLINIFKFTLKSFFLNRTRIILSLYAFCLRNANFPFLYRKIKMWNIYPWY